MFFCFKTSNEKEIINLYVGLKKYVCTKGSGKMKPRMNKPFTTMVEDDL
jgi:hypothetical protein